MNLPESKEFTEQIGANRKVSFKDEQTKVTFETCEESTKIKIDHGIYNEKNIGLNKCDFGLYEDKSKILNLIELKGTVYEKAYEQLEGTINKFEEDKYLTKDDRIRWFIVIHERAKTPNNLSSLKRKLAKKVHKYNRGEKDMMKNIWQVVTGASKKTFIQHENNKILCANKEGIKLSELRWVFKRYTIL